MLLKLSVDGDHIVRMVVVAKHNPALRIGVFGLGVYSQRIRQPIIVCARVGCPSITIGFHDERPDVHVAVYLERSSGLKAEVDGISALPRAAHHSDRIGALPHPELLLRLGDLIQRYVLRPNHNGRQFAQVLVAVERGVLEEDFLRPEDGQVAYFLGQPKHRRVDDDPFVLIGPVEVAAGGRNRVFGEVGRPQHTGHGQETPVSASQFFDRAKEKHVIRHAEVPVPVALGENAVGRQCFQRDG